MLYNMFLIRNTKEKHQKSIDFQCFINQSGWQDSNLRPHAPQTRTLNRAELHPAELVVQK